MERLNDNQVLDLRAKERTLDGAYFRTSIGLMSASLLAIKLFDKELRIIGVIFISFGISMFCIDMMRRYHLKDFNYEEELNQEQFLKYFHTSGNLVFLVGFLAILAYSSVLFVLLNRA